MLSQTRNRNIKENLSSSNPQRIEILEMSYQTHQKYSNIKLFVTMILLISLGVLVFTLSVHLWVVFRYNVNFLWPINLLAVLPIMYGVYRLMFIYTGIETYYLTPDKFLIERIFFGRVNNRVWDRSKVSSIISLIHMTNDPSDSFQEVLIWDDADKNFESFRNLIMTSPGYKSHHLPEVFRTRMHEQGIKQVLFYYFSPAIGAPKELMSSLYKRRRECTHCETLPSLDMKATIISCKSCYTLVEYF